jgi:hypothetical protein
MSRWMCVLSLCTAAASIISAQTVQSNAATEERLIATNSTYSSAILNHLSPEMLLAEEENKLNSGHHSDHPEFDRFIHLPFAAKAALEAGANDKARSYAEEGLRLLKDHPQIRAGTGNAIFYCNLVLGRLALLDGDIPQAEQYLLLSGTTTGSPGLDSFGPNMSLARELLKHSRREPVLKYLDECRLFWQQTSERGRLADWSAEIERNRMPAFGGNLFY